MLFSSKGHRRVPMTARIVAGVGVVGAGIAAPLMATGSASAASVSTWDRVAQCESSGNWQNHDSGGNGHYGGLQFSPSSWAAAGGLKYAPRADQATKDQQIAVAEKLLAMQGPGAWQCASAGGLTSGGPAANVNPASGSTSATSTQAAAKQAKPQVQQQSTATQQQTRQAVQHNTARAVNHAAAQPQAATASGGYTVAAGDTLSSIAKSHGVSWQKLYDLNKDTVGGNPDLIIPGQHLDLS